MDEYITAFEAFDILFENKSLTKNEQLERLFNYYYSGRLNFYYEIYGQIDVIGVQLSSDDRDQTTPTIPEKLIGFFNLAREHNVGYFKQILPLEQGEEWVESEMFSEMNYDESHDYLVYNERIGITIIEDEQKQQWQLKSPIYNSADYPIYPEVAELALRKSQVLNIIQAPKLSSSVQKRQKSSDKHEKNRQEVLNAALYEIANNYSCCIRGKHVSAEQVAEAIYSNAEKHWPDLASVRNTKSTPMGTNRMADHIREVIKKKI